MKPHILVIVDRYPILPEYSPSSWMPGSLHELSMIADIDVVSVVNTLPRISNLLYRGRDWEWLKKIIHLQRLSDEGTYRIEHMRALGLPARISWKLLSDFLQMQLVPRIIRKYSGRTYDAVLMHGTYPMGKTGLTVARRLKVPFILVNHEGYRPYVQYFSQSAAQELAEVIRSSDFVITLSPNHQQELHEYFPAQATAIVRHGITMETDARKISHDGFHIITAARLEGREKRVDVLLEGFALLKCQENIKARFTIAGDGVDLPRLKKIAHQLCLDDDVVFPGWIGSQALHQVFQSQDVFICPSQQETFSYAAIEAIAAGVPVIGLPQAGILSEFVSLYPSLTWLNELTPESVADKLKAFVAAKQLWPEIQNTMQQVVKQQFSWDAHRASLRTALSHLLPTLTENDL